MKRYTMLVVLLMITSMSLMFNSCRGKLVKKTIYLTGIAESDSVIAKLQYRLEKCEISRKKCCDLIN